VDDSKRIFCKNYIDQFVALVAKLAPASANAPPAAGG